MPSPRSRKHLFRLTLLALLATLGAGVFPLVRHLRESRALETLKTTDSIWERELAMDYLVSIQSEKAARWCIEEVKRDPLPLWESREGITFDAPDPSTTGSPEQRRVWRLLEEFEKSERPVELSAEDYLIALSLEDHLALKPWEIERSWISRLLLRIDSPDLQRLSSLLDDPDPRLRARCLARIHDLEELPASTLSRVRRRYDPENNPVLKAVILKIVTEKGVRDLQTNEWLLRELFTEGQNPGEGSEGSPIYESGFSIDVDLTPGLRRQIVSALLDPGASPPILQKVLRIISIKGLSAEDHPAIVPRVLDLVDVGCSKGIPESLNLQLSPTDSSQDFWSTSFVLREISSLIQDLLASWIQKPGCRKIVTRALLGNEGLFSRWVLSYFPDTSPESRVRQKDEFSWLQDRLRDLKTLEELVSVLEALDGDDFFRSHPSLQEEFRTLGSELISRLRSRGFDPDDPSLESLHRFSQQTPRLPHPSQLDPEEELTEIPLATRTSPGGVFHLRFSRRVTEGLRSPDAEHRREARNSWMKRDLSAPFPSLPLAELLESPHADTRAFALLELCVDLPVSREDLEPQMEKIHELLEDDEAVVRILAILAWSQRSGNPEDRASQFRRLAEAPDIPVRTRVLRLIIHGTLTTDEKIWSALNPEGWPKNSPSSPDESSLDLRLEFEHHVLFDQRSRDLPRIPRGRRARLAREILATFSRVLHPENSYVFNRYARTYLQRCLPEGLPSILDFLGQEGVPASGITICLDAIQNLDLRVNLSDSTARRFLTLLESNQIHGGNRGTLARFLLQNRPRGSAGKRILTALLPSSLEEPEETDEPESFYAKERHFRLLFQASRIALEFDLEFPVSTPWLQKWVTGNRLQKRLLAAPHLARRGASRKLLTHAVCQAFKARDEQGFRLHSTEIWEALAWIAHEGHEIRERLFRDLEILENCNLGPLFRTLASMRGDETKKRRYFRKALTGTRRSHIQGALEGLEYHPELRLEYLDLLRPLVSEHNIPTPEPWSWRYMEQSPIPRLAIRTLKACGPAARTALPELRAVAEDPDGKWVEEAREAIRVIEGRKPPGG